MSGCTTLEGNNVHDVQPWSTLSALERNSYIFLRSNMVTLCRRHHEAAHNYRQAAVA